MNLFGLNTPQALLIAGGIFLSFIYPSFVKKGDKKDKSLVSNIGLVSLAGGIAWVGYNYFMANKQQKSSNFAYALAANSMPVGLNYAPPINDLSAIKNNFDNQTAGLPNLDNYLKDFTNGMPYPTYNPVRINPLAIPSLSLHNEAADKGSNTVRMI